MTERRLERSAVHRGDLILVNAQLPFAGPEEQDRVCLDANVMLARRAADTPLFHLGLATPASTVVQIFLCGIWYLRRSHRLNRLGLIRK